MRTSYGAYHPSTWEANGQHRQSDVHNRLAHNGQSDLYDDVIHVGAWYFQAQNI